MKFDTVLVANRGEIALRVMRACRELGMRSVAVYSEADRDAPHVRYADAAFLLGPEPAPGSGGTRPYLDSARIIEIAQTVGAGALHPGYGFLAENAEFARSCVAAGLVFVGPTAEAIQRMGGKTAARQEASAAGVPLVPGTLEPVDTPAQVRELGAQFGYPIAIKAVGGGGGRGLRVAATAEAVDEAFASARREAESAFGNPLLYVEKYFTNPRHIEVQVLADTHGSALYLGERDCSVQRRHQKLIEECPAPGFTLELRRSMGQAAVALCHQVGYVGAGTLEFLFENDQFYFLEMNTRIQVEHTVTEMVTGIDLVQAQLRIAQGEPLWLAQDDITWRGHAIECRINAEDAAHNFRPALGVIGAYQEPVGYGVRVDSGARAGYVIPPFYDSMIAKLITWGATRNEAIGRMRRALGDFVIEGVTTVVPFHQLALAHPVFAAGGATVNFIPEQLAEQLAGLPTAEPQNREAVANVTAPRVFTVEVNSRRFDVKVFGADNRQQAAGNGLRTTDGRPTRKKASGPAVDGVISPMQGTLVSVKCEAGQVVEAGQVLFVLEAMKMENEVIAPHAGTLDLISGVAGTVIESGAVLATFRT
ncbi:MAG: acetyl-CoA carboxylase biotin carboxylase subunit [Roseiflexaceae bacterium]|nr:acetyl-CoA carboxylase biotin carboxylase subunit [Roseiflexaceae bacterium]